MRNCDARVEEEWDAFLRLLGNGAFLRLSVEKRMR